MMTSRVSMIRSLAAGLTFLFLASCNEPIPSKDLQSAKRSIAVAEAAKAKKYDPHNLDLARQNYKNALKLVANDDNADARKKALDAKLKADLATENSRRLLAKETINEAAKLVKQAKQKRAGFLANVHLKRAIMKLNEARKKFANKQWIDAYTSAENSKEASGKAIDMANRKMAELNKAINNADLAIKRADSNSAVKKYALDKLKESKKIFGKAVDNKKKVDDPNGNISSDDPAVKNKLAEDAYNNALKGAYDAEKNANDAVRIALERQREEFRKQALKKLSEAKRLIEQIKKLKKQGLIKGKVILPFSPPPKHSTGGATKKSNTVVVKKNITKKTGVKESYNSAMTALKRAETTYKTKNYKNSITNSEEAIRLAKELLSRFGKKKYYTVRLIPAARDCLWRISSYRYIYNNATYWPKIWKANKHLIVDPDLIYPGQKFEIPKK